MPLAPWWKRLVAILVDGAIVGLVYLIISAFIAAVVNSPNTATDNSQSSGGAVFAAIVVLWIVFSIPAAIYYGAMNGSKRGQTIGKMALGIAVRDARTGGPIGFWRGFGRFLITLVFEIALFIPALIDVLSPLWDSRRQSWHDKVAHSVVVDLKP